MHSFLNVEGKKRNGKESSFGAPLPETNFTKCCGVERDEHLGGES
jgi:hypothetical protein